MELIYIAVGVVLLFLLFFISTSNKLERQKVKVEEADSGIDVALTKRYDTLTKLFDAAKGYMKHEQEVLLQTIRLRQHMPLTEKAEAEQKMAEAARQVRLVAEAYPQLASQAMFVELQKGVMDTEEHLQAARRLYNANISKLNQMVVSFPSSIIAGMKGMKKLPMFEAETAKRSDVSLKF